MSGRFSVGLRDIAVGLGIACAGCGPSPREEVGRAVVTIQNDMVGDTAAAGSRCAYENGGQERSYSLNLPEKSRVRLADLNDNDRTYCVRKVCDKPESELLCARGNADSTAVLDGGEYFFVSDGETDVSAEMDVSQEYDSIIETQPVATPAKDAPSCERPIALPAYTPLDFDTFRWADNFSFEKQEAGAPDAVFKFVLDGPSHVSGRFWRRFAGSMVILKRCGDAETAVFKGDGGRFELPEPLDGGEYYLVVDGDTPAAFGKGNIVLSVRGVEQVGRVCKTATRLPVGRRAVGRFEGAENRFTGAEGIGYDTADKVYRFTLKREIALDISVSAKDGGSLPFYVRTACTDRDSQVVSSQGLPMFGRVIRTDRLAAGTYYLIVENREAAAEERFDILVAPTL